jgi:hypothetical protein
VGIALTLFDLWRRLPPEQRRRALDTARKHGPKAAELARKHGPGIARRAAELRKKR